MLPLKTIENITFWLIEPRALSYAETLLILNSEIIASNSKEEYGGWTHPQIVEDFEDYARLCYEGRGQHRRLKYWKMDLLSENWIVPFNYAYPCNRVSGTK